MMAILEVEGSKFTKQLTGPHLVWWLRMKKNKTKDEAEAIVSQNNGDFFVRLNATDVEELNRSVPFKRTEWQRREWYND